MPYLYLFDELREVLGFVHLRTRLRHTVSRYTAAAAPGAAAAVAATCADECT